MKPDHEQLLKLISKHSINNPITNLELEKATGIKAAALEQILDNLAYKIPAAIGRCKVIKAGVEIVQIWPSASFERSRCIDPDFNNKRFMPQQPVRRTPAETNHTQETTMAREAKVSLIDIAKHVQKNPGITIRGLEQDLAGDDIKERKNTNTKIMHMVKQRTLERFDQKVGDKVVRCLRLGDNEIWLTQHGLIEETAKRSLQTEVTTPTEAPQPRQEIREQKAADQEAAQAPVIQPAPAYIEADGQTMKVAYFSDQTMQLIGLQPEPVTLNKEQVSILIDFMSSCCLVTP
jgi:hypothetical protein